MESVKQQIERLRAEIDRHNHQYYVLNSPEISDYDFDMMLKQLESLEKNIPNMTTRFRPRIGSGRISTRPSSNGNTGVRCCRLATLIP